MKMPSTTATGNARASKREEGYDLKSTGKSAIDCFRNVPGSD